MPRPDVSITLTNNRLGRLPESEDGTSAIICTGVAIVGSVTLGEVYGPLRSISEVEALGITRTWGVANKSLAWHHLNEFFAEAGMATPIYFMMVADTVTMAQMMDGANAYARKVIEATGGKVRLLGATRIPDASYTEPAVGQLDPDIVAAVTKAQALGQAQFDLHRPVRFLVEGRAWGGAYATTTDLRDGTAGPNANKVGVVLYRSAETAAESAAFGAYAAVGMVLGRLARIEVQRSAGRVKDGPLQMVTASMSDGTLTKNMTSVALDVLDAKGYIFAMSYPDQPGWYLNGSSASCMITDDYANIEDGRTIDKAARVLYSTFVVELLDNVRTDKTTGKLLVSVCKHYESLGEEAINAQMGNNIDGVKLYVNPDQNVTQTNTLAISADIVKQGTVKRFNITLGYALKIAQ